MMLEFQAMAWFGGHAKSCRRSILVDLVANSSIEPKQALIPKALHRVVRDYVRYCKEWKSVTS